MGIFAWFHICVGLVALVAGLAALVFQKGSRLHRVSGRIFALVMLLTAGGGAIYAGFDQLITLLVGVTCCYLVITALVTVWPRQSYSRSVDVAILITSFSLTLAFMIGGLLAPPVALLPSNTTITPEVYFFFTGVASLLVVGDGLNLYFGGLLGKWRLARHLWRMGFALHIVAGSSTRLLPEAFQAWGEHCVDGVALVISIWWLHTLVGRSVAAWLWQRKRSLSKSTVSTVIE